MPERLSDEQIQSLVTVTQTIEDDSILEWHRTGDNKKRMEAIAAKYLRAGMLIASGDLKGINMPSGTLFGKENRFNTGFM